jgi:predicted amidohydrolase
MTTVSVALIQLRTPTRQDAALAQAMPLIRQAAASGAQLIMTPEGTNLLQKNRAAMFEALCPAEDDACVQGLAALASELNIWLLIGSALVLRADGQAANRSLMISPDGQIVAAYDKIHMFDVDLPTGERHRESSAYRPGEAAVIANLPWQKLGLSICYDMRFSYLYRALAQAGAGMISVPAAFTRPTGAAHWEVLLRARAIETGSFILAPAQGGTHQDGRATWGHSLIVGPWGEVIAQLDHDEPGVLSAVLDLEEITKARSAIPALVHDRAFSGPAA